MFSYLIRLSCAVTIAALAGCAASPAKPCSPLGTSACGAQATNVARDVAGWHNAQQPGCPYIRPVSAQIVRDEGDAVVEHWTIEGCEGKQFTYRAYLLPSGGALTVMVSDVRADDRVAP
jgi:hypothetical protein